MELVLDASALVGELFRQRGRRILTHPETALYMPPRQWDEALHEVERRVGHVAAQLDLDADELLDGARDLAEATIVVVPDDVYEGFLDAARERIDDPDDAPAVALALALDAGVWTRDRDFFGSGVATWRAEVLARVLECHERASRQRDGREGDVLGPDRPKA